MPASANIAAAADNLGDDVNHLHHWDEGHGASTDPGGFITWIAKVAGYKNRAMKPGAREPDHEVSPEARPVRPSLTNAASFPVIKACAAQPRRRALSRSPGPASRRIYRPLKAPTISRPTPPVPLTPPTCVINPQPIPVLTETHQSAT